MDFRILGPVEAWDGTQRLDLGGSRPRAVLASLLVHANEVLSVDRLIDELWGEAPPPTARNVLQCYVSRLRRVLDRRHDGAGPGGVLLTRPPGYLLRVEAGQLDLHRFEGLLAQARGASAAGEHAQAADHLRAALALWRGPALGGVTATGLRRVEAARLEECRLEVLEERIEADLQLGCHAELIGELAALVAEHPLHETLHGQLMVVLYRSGRQAEALEVYRRLRQKLAGELGLEPGPNLQQLERAILNADPSLDLAGTPGGAAIAPISTSPLAAVGGQQRPDGTERTLLVPPRQLPPDVATFTGRRAELARLETLLNQVGGRGPAVVVTIDGSAGVGKSALAIHAAHQLAERFPDGQLYVDLQGASAGLAPLGACEVLGRFLRALGVDARCIPAGLEEQGALFRSLVATRRVLMVLDNAADERQVRALLPGSPRGAVLVTSRRRLSGLEPAHAMRLEVLEPEHAVGLLAKVAGAERVATEPESARAIARLCGCLPLAVRIAGAKLVARPHWRLARLAEHLSDEHGRLDELTAGDLEVRASVALSYQGQGEHERRIFRLLGLLTAPDFAAWVAAALLDCDQASAERLLERLGDARLLEVAGEDATGQLRYRFHDLLRIFARERLLEEDSAPARRAAMERALDASLALTKLAAALLEPCDRWASDPGGGTPPAVGGHGIGVIRRNPLAWLASERVGLVTAVEQAHHAELWELAWELTAALAEFFELHSYWEDWQHTAELAFTAAGKAGNRHGEVTIANSLAMLCRDRACWDEATAWLERALEADPADQRQTAVTLRTLGDIHWVQGQLDDALGCLRRSLQILEELGDRHEEAATMRSLGGVYRDQGRYRDAGTCLEQSLAVFRELGDRQWEAATLHCLGEVYQAQGRPDDTAACVDQGLMLVRALGDRRAEAYLLQSLGDLRRSQGRLDEAASCLGESLVCFAELGDRRGRTHALHAIGELRREQGRLDEAIACFRESLEIARELRLALWQGKALKSLGAGLASRGDRAAAAAAWQDALAVFERLGAPDAAEVEVLLEA